VLTDRTPPPLALAFHGVEHVPKHSPNAAMCVEPAALDRYIRTLKKWGYRLVTFRELAEAVSNDEARGLAALTFDDGFAGCAAHLPEILRAHGASATVFVVSGWLGHDHPEAPWARIVDETQLKLLARAGIEIGSHSATHPHLDRLPYDDALAELRDSKSSLEALIDTEVVVAAYPFGAATDETRRACRDAGYRAACRFRAAGSWRDLFDLPRQPVGRGTSQLALRLKRDDQYEPLRRLRAARTFRRALSRRR
jgi:peptidoglycan/xylan/chitin deacetylase (PgdA/CDA1 family)